MSNPFKSDTSKSITIEITHWDVDTRRQTHIKSPGMRDANTIDDFSYETECDQRQEFYNKQGYFVGWEIKIGKPEDFIP